MTHHTTWQVPPEEARVDGALWRLSRAWPMGGDPAAGLAVEADSGRGSVRAGLWRDGGLELLSAGRDPRLPDLAGHAAAGTVVSHRLRRRAVIRIADGGALQYVKVVRPGRAAAILDGIGRATAFETGFRTPEVLGSTDSEVRFAALPGRSLHDQAAFSDEAWAAAWAAVGEALTRSRRATVPTGTAVAPRHHGVEDEVRALGQWLERATPWVADAADLARLVDDAAARLRSLGAHPWVPTHRDLHDKQLLWEPGGGPGLLDVDTACLAHPALDLGNLRAHAHWRVLQGVWERDRARVVTDTVDHVAAWLGVAAGDVGVFERAASVRIGCVYAFRPAYAGTARRLREALAQAD